MLASKRRLELRSRSTWMSCFVGLADSTMFEIDCTPQSDGLEILTKVCRLLGVVETDYFGLSYQTGQKGDALWLNLRNCLCHELPGSPPYRLELRVKFFVPSHVIQQDVTRHLFYTNVCELFLSDKLRLTDRHQIAQIASLIAQAEASATYRPTEQQIYDNVLPVGVHSDSQMTSLIRSELAKLDGLSKQAAEYRLLQAVDGLPLLGASYYAARNSAGTTVNIATTSTDVVFFSENWKQLSSVPYTAIRRVTNDACNIKLEIMSDDGAVTRQWLRLCSRLLANALYRAMTENYYFYHCDTVCRDVLLQSSRDLKGILAALFNENTEMGKSYVFDIQRTKREAYDRVRRLLYQSNTKLTTDVSSRTSLDQESSQADVTSDAVSMTTLLSNAGHRDNCPSTCTCFQALCETIVKCRDSMQCQVCTDGNVDVAFVPCGHVTCCVDCADRLEQCPLCKADITHRLKIFLSSHCLHS